MEPLQSLGYAAGLYQRPPKEILAGLSVAQVKYHAEPALTLNGVKYFADSDIAKAVAWLVQRDAEEAAKKAVEANRG